MLDWFEVLEMRGILQQGWMSMPRWGSAAAALAEDGSPEAAEVLARAYVSGGGMQRRVLRDGLLGLRSQASIERVWWVWSVLRSDALAEVFACRPLRLPCRVDLLVLSRLKLGLREELRRLGTRDVITELVKASADRERAIAGSAASLLVEMADQVLAASVMADAVCSTATPPAASRACLSALRQARSPQSVDAICSAWARTRHPSLDVLLAERGLTASGPPEVAALTRLRLGLEISADKAGELLRACDDRDPRIAQEARWRLAEAPAGWRPSLAAVVLDGDCPVSARALLPEAAPREPSARALFFLLTDQVDRALDLDFDLSLLSSAYRGGAPKVRRAVAAAIRRSGSSTLTRILARKQGDDFVHLTMSDTEWEALVHGLDHPDRVDELWSLMIDAPPAWSADLYDRLVRLRYRPAEDGQALWNELTTLRWRVSGADWGVLESGSEPLRRFTPPASEPSSSRITFSANGRCRVTNDPLGTREYADLGSGHTVTMEEARRFDHVALSQDGRRIAVGRSDEWRVYDVDLDRSMHRFRCVFGQTVQPGVRALRFSPDGRHLAVANRLGVDLYDMADGGKVGHVPKAGAILAFDDDSGLLAVAGGVREVRVCEVPSGRVRHVLTGARDVVDVCFGPGAATLTARQENGMAAEWSLCRTPAAAFSLAMQLKAEAQASRSAAWAWAVAQLAYRRRYDIEIADDLFVPDFTDIEIEVA